MGKQKTVTNQLDCEEEEGDTGAEGHSISGVHTLSQSKAACNIWVHVLLNGRPIKMELDTGANIDQSRKHTFEEE